MKHYVLTTKNADAYCRYLYAEERSLETITKYMRYDMLSNKWGLAFHEEKAIYVISHFR